MHTQSGSGQNWEHKHPSHTTATPSPQCCAAPNQRKATKTSYYSKNLTRVRVAEGLKARGQCRALRSSVAPVSVSDRRFGATVPEPRAFHKILVFADTEVGAGDYVGFVRLQAECPRAPLRV